MGKFAWIQKVKKMKAEPLIIRLLTAYALGSLVLLLYALLRDDILLELPTKFLCKPDCKGLCSQCGQNLNLGDCGCNQRRIDPRLEVLQQFFNN